MSGGRVVVTGGLGFVGSHLCPELARRGYEVTAIDDLSAAHAGRGYDATRRDGLGTARAGGGRCRVVLGRAEHAERSGLLDRADAVIHLAAQPGVRTRATTAALAERNVAVAARVAQAAAGRGIRFVLASTSSVYGDADALPTPEDAPPRPLNAYARSKAAAEAACPEAVVARLFTVYGPGQRPDMAFARWIESLGRGQAVPWCAAPGAARDFTFVDDAVRGLIAALEHGRGGQAYNVGGGASIPVRDALAELEALTGAPARLVRVEHGVREAAITAACGRRAREELGYRPLVGLREGLARQLAAARVLSRPAAAA